MPYETRTLSEIWSAAASSLDPDFWDYAFERTVPIAIYVSTSDDDSREIAEIIENRLNGELRELGFEGSESLTDFFGSFLQLNLSKTPKTETGPGVEKKLRILRKRLAGYFKDGEFFQDLKQAGKDTHKILKIAVGIGTIVILLTQAPTAGLAVGGFVVSAKAWSLLMVATEGSDIVELAKKLLTESPEAKASLNRDISDTDPVVVPNPSEKQIRELEKKLEEQQSRIQEQDLRQKRMEEEIRALRSRPSKQ
jgi:hypothetical protein